MFASFFRANENPEKVVPKSRPMMTRASTCFATCFAAMLVKKRISAADSFRQSNQKL